MVALVEVGLCATLTFILLRLIRGLGGRLLLLFVAALAADGLQHTFTVWFF